MKSCFIIAELSANHGHKIENAKRTIKKAKEVGADAIKIQTYTADTITIDCDNEYFKIKQGTIWDGTTLYKLYQEAYTPWEWHKELFDYAKEIGITIFSTPFDFSAVDLLEKLNTPIYKIASFEITDIPLIEYAASKGKPMIISTGIATLEEMKDAIEACKRVGNSDITLLKCTSQYPAKLEDANLKTMIDMKEKFNVKIGVSDHTIGSIVPTTAVALGAEVIEKHFIIDRNIGGPDASFSMTPDEFKEMVDRVRDVEKTLGKVDYELTEKKKNSRVFARSLFVVEDIKKGEILNEKNVRSIRPGYGIAPKYYKDILGKKVVVDIKRGTPLNLEMIEINK
ncbi:pseudaminic acid synthase [Haliovirga abyssi]|uniref:N-acetylneuraminic acid synthase n=1 Tax=Haliovirga abyssi TaxID=2996794 RepID=A0AAU9DFG3_9FUSO|nr:pseudaminic acid synthase [Haliovirga abyssi]BDU51152.1 N-acetylneuraminic acid synthase [Haliovirga abyssi]